ncbi:hypothetical protein ACHAXS_008575 [Conticribra weissflogii]
MTTSHPTSTTLGGRHCRSSTSSDVPRRRTLLKSHTQSLALNGNAASSANKTIQRSSTTVESSSYTGGASVTSALGASTGSAAAVSSSGASLAGSTSASTVGGGGGGANRKERKSNRFAIVTNKERKKEFDLAVKDIMEQRKQVTQAQRALLKAQRQEKAEKHAQELLAMAGELRVQKEKLTEKEKANYNNNHSNHSTHSTHSSDTNSRYVKSSESVDELGGTHHSQYSSNFEALEKLRQDYYRKHSNGAGTTSTLGNGSLSSGASAGKQQRRRHTLNLKTGSNALNNNAESKELRRVSNDQKPGDGGIWMGGVGSSGSGGDMGDRLGQHFVPARIKPRKPKKSSLSRSNASGNEAVAPEQNEENSNAASAKEEVSQHPNANDDTNATTRAGFQVVRQLAANALQSSDREGAPQDGDEKRGQRFFANSRSVTGANSGPSNPYILEDLTPTSRRKGRESLPVGSGSGGFETAATAAKDYENETVREREKRRDPFYIPPYKPSHRKKRETSKPLSKLNDVPQAANGTGQTHATNSGSVNSTLSTSHGSVENYKLEDLVPTKRDSRVRKTSIYDYTEQDSTGAWEIASGPDNDNSNVDHSPQKNVKRVNGIAVHDVNFTGEDAESNSHENHQIDDELDNAPITKDRLKSLVGRWRSKSLTFGEPIDFNLDDSGSSTQEKLLRPCEYDDIVQRVPSSEADNTALNGPSEVTSPSSPKPLPYVKARPKSKSDDKCRRTMLLNSQAKFTSGGTGRTTSTSSMTDSLSSNNNIPSFGNAAYSDHYHNTTSTTTNTNNLVYSTVNSVILEEEVRSSMKSIKSRRSSGEHSVEPSVSEATCNKSQHSRSSTRSKISQLSRKPRRNLFKRLIASPGLSSPTDVDEKPTRGQPPKRVNSNASDYDNPPKEAEKQFAMGLNRKSSSRSVSSTMSSITNGSSTSGLFSRKSQRWKSFRQRSKTNLKAENETDSTKRHPPAKVIVTSGNDDIGESDRSGEGVGGVAFRNQTMSFPQRESASSVSRLSHHSSGDECSSQISRFSDFYDNSSHVHAVTRILLKNGSKRSIHSSSLHPVKEQAEGSAEPRWRDDDSESSDSTTHTLYRFPAHAHDLVHVCPQSLYPDTPGWQCDECGKETFDLKVWAYVSTQENYLVCGECFSKSGFRIS